MLRSFGSSLRRRLRRRAAVLGLAITLVSWGALAVFHRRAAGTGAVATFRATGDVNLVPLAAALQLVFVVSNIEQFARDWDLPHDELCFALAAREVISATQRSIPWVRDHLVSLCTAFVNGYNLESESLERRIHEALNELGDMSGLGDFDGTGTWTLESQPDGTTLATLDWRPTVVMPLVRRLTPALRPLFRANHAAVMRWGQERVGEEAARVAADLADEDHVRRLAQRVLQRWQGREQGVGPARGC